jgi:uncharacterized protein
MIERKIYLDRILPLIGSPLIKVLMGMRRVGKSALLLQVRETLRARGILPDQICWIDKEDLSFDSIRTYQDLAAHVDATFAAFAVRKPGAKKYLFIDEVQEIAQWEKAVRHYAKQADMEVFITGSNATMLSSELSTHLAGRFVAFHVHPLCFREYLGFCPAGSFDEFMRLGGLPGVALLPNEEAKQQALEGILHTVMFRDIIARHSIRNGALLGDILRFIAVNIGYPTATKKIADFLKKERVSLAFETVRDYLLFFEQAHLLHSVGWIDAVGKRSMELNAKYYFSDIGLRNKLTGWRDDYRGQLLENIVHHELRVRGYELVVGRVGTQEVDFVATRAGEKLYVQVCYLLASPETEQREFSPLMTVPDNYPKLVLSMDKDWGSDYMGIKRMHLVDWLTAG